MQRYLQQFDTPMGAILSAVYEVADPKSKVYTKSDKGTIDVDPLENNLVFTGGDNAKAVLKWVKDNLSAETNTQIDSRLAVAKKAMKKAEENIIKNEEQAIEADRLKLKERAKDQATDITDAQEVATAARNALEADTAQDVVVRGSARGDIDNTTLEAGLDVDTNIEDIKPILERRAKENKRVATAEKKERKPVNKAQRARDSADENFSRLLANDKLDFTSTNNKKVLTKVAKRNLDRAKEFANASNDPEGNLIKLDKFLLERGEGAKRVAKAQAKLDKDKPKKPPTAKQTIVDNIYTKFKNVKGLTREDITGAFNFVTMDVLQSKRIAAAKKYFDTATPADIKEAALGYIFSKESDWLPLELDIDVVTSLNSNLTKQVKTLLKKGDLLGALKELSKNTSSPRVKQIIKALRGAAEIGGTKIELVNTKELSVRGYTATTDDSVLAGAYDSNTNTILLNTDVPITAHTILHEVTHAATMDSLSNPSDPVTQRLQTLFDDLKDDLSSFYGVTNLREFVAEAFSNTDFQQALSEMDVKGKRYTALQSFFDAITNFIRSKISSSGDIEFKGSALAAIDQAILATLSTNPDSRGIEVFSNMQLTPEITQRFIDKVNKSATLGSPLPKFLLKIKDFILNPSIKEVTNILFLKSIDAQIIGDVARRLGYGDLGHRFHKAYENQRADLNHAIAKVDKEITNFYAWAKSVDADMVNNFNLLIYSLDFGATIYDVDPSLLKGAAVLKYKKQKAENGQYLIDIWSKQQKIWSALGTEGQKQFKSQRALYKRQHEDILKIIFGEIDLVAGQDKELGKKMKAKIYQQMAGRGNLEVYWPLVRDGKYKLSYVTQFKNEDGTLREEPVFLMFESERERDAAAVEASNDKFTIGIPKRMEGDFGTASWNSAPSGSFVSDILTLLKANGVTDPKIQEEVMQLFIKTLPETSFAKSLQRRNNVIGFIPDAALALRKKGYQQATQVVKMKHSAKIRALEDEVLLIQRGGQPEEAVWNQNNNDRYRKMFDLIGKEMLSRGKFARQGSDYKMLDTVAKRVNQVAFIWTIGFNASSAAVNLSQIPLVVIPYLAPKFGFDATVGAFRRAAYSTLSNYNSMAAPYDRKEVTVTKNGVSTIEIQFTLKDSVRKDIYALTKGNPKALSKQQADEKIAELERYIPLVQAASGRGLLDTTVEMDVSGVSDAKGGTKKGFIENATSLTSWGAASAIMFNAAEKFNRQTTLMASYDLILQQLEGGTRFKSGLQGKFIDVPKGYAAKAELAAAEAAYMTHETNGGAVLETTPSIMRAGFGRIAGMYKSFGLRMYSTFTKSLYQALGDVAIDYSTAEGKQLRREAMAQLAAVSATSVIFAGVQGHMLFGLLNVIFDFPNEEDDETFRTATRKKVGELLYKGPLSYYTGVDVSQRVSLTNLLFNENRYLSNPTEEELIAHYAGGPAWSTAKRIGRGLVDYKDGNIQRSIESILPAGLTNLARVIPKNPLIPQGRFSKDKGMYTRGENPIFIGLTTKDFIASGLGFPPINYTFDQEDAAQLKSISIGLKKKRSAILKKYSQAQRTNDLESVKEAMVDMIAYNQKWPSFTITEDTLALSLKNNIAAAELMYKGTSLESAVRDELIARDIQYKR